MAWEIFAMLATQPRVGGMGGFFGVDLAAFPVICDIKCVPADERAILLDKVLLVNTIAVDYWNEDTEGETK